MTILLLWIISSVTLITGNLYFLLISLFPYDDNNITAESFCCLHATPVNIQLCLPLTYLALGTSFKT